MQMELTYIADKAPIFSGAKLNCKQPALPETRHSAMIQAVENIFLNVNHSMSQQQMIPISCLNQCSNHAHYRNIKTLTMQNDLCRPIFQLCSVLFFVDLGKKQVGGGDAGVQFVIIPAFANG
jgi:hypothetical protein